MNTPLFKYFTYKHIIKIFIAIQQSHDPIQRKSLAESLPKAYYIFSGMTGKCYTNTGKCHTTLPPFLHSRNVDVRFG